jgi:hypothetical protein
MVKSIVQVMIVALAKTVYRIDYFVHGFLFLTVLTLYTIFNYRVRTFNYGRVWMWNIVSLLSSIWVGTLAMADQLTATSTVFVVLLFIGFGVLILCGVLV